MARIKHREKRGPGLLFILVTLVVVALVAARFFGFYPGAEQAEEVPLPPKAEVVDTTPKVLVFHSHATENYSPKDSHERGGAYGDVVLVGRLVVEKLRERGIYAIHDTTVHDKPRYSEAFLQSAQMVEKVLAQQPQIQMVLDIHRDGLQDKPDGFVTAQIEGKSAAKILFVVGETENPALEQNMAFAERINDALEKRYPGISRGVRVFKSNYSGDLHANSVMVIIGDWRGNTIEQAKVSAEFLAEALATLITN